MLSFLHTGTPVVDMSFEGPYEGPNNRSVLADGTRRIYVGQDIYKETSEGSGTFTSVLTETSFDETQLEEQYNNNLIELENEIASNGTSTYSIYDGFINWDNSTLDTNSIYKIPHFGSGSDYWVMSDFPNCGTGNCAPTAVTNIMWYYGWQYGSGYNNNIADRVTNRDTFLGKAMLIHDTLAAGMKTNLNGTYFQDITYGIRHFLVDPKGATWNDRYILEFNGVYNTIVESYPIVMGIIFGNQAHVVCVIGRANSNIGVRYMMVMDGWHRYGRFVRDGYYRAIQGSKIWVKM